MASRKAQTRAYLDFQREIEQLLYEMDPDGMGSSIGSPRDEYSDEAARVLPLLIRAANGEDAELPWSDPDVRERLIAVATRFRSRLASGDIPVR
jgi:hypothetical protein